MSKTRSENNKFTVPSPITGQSGMITPHVAQKKLCMTLDICQKLE